MGQQTFATTATWVLLLAITGLIVYFVVSTARSRTLDRRLIYLGLFMATLLPLVSRVPLPTVPSKPVIDLFDTVDSLPRGTIVFLATEWDAGTQAENRPQMLALARHMLRKNLRIVMMSIGAPNAPVLSQGVLQDAVEYEGRGEYGTDYINLGYKEATRAWLRSFTQDIKQQVQADWKQRPLSETFLRDVSRWGPDPGQIVSLIDVTGSATINEWRPLLYPQKVKVGLACTGVMAPEQYPYLANRQLVGMLTGLKGAAEYEYLLRRTDPGVRPRLLRELAEARERLRQKTPGALDDVERTERMVKTLDAASQQMPGQSAAHGYILILLAMGNAGIVGGWIRARRARRGRSQ